MLASLLGAVLETALNKGLKLSPELKHVLSKGQHKVLNVDIRDQKSFNTGHINGAIHLSNNNFDKFVNSTDKSNTIIVYCYHGNSSQKAAQLLINFGFLNVYSLNGGYEEWKTKLERI